MKKLTGSNIQFSPLLYQATKINYETGIRSNYFLTVLRKILGRHVWFSLKPKLSLLHWFNSWGRIFLYLTCVFFPSNPSGFSYLQKKSFSVSPLWLPLRNSFPSQHLYGLCSCDFSCPLSPAYHRNIEPVYQLLGDTASATCRSSFGVEMFFNTTKLTSPSSRLMGSFREILVLEFCTCTDF